MSFFSKVLHVYKPSDSCKDDPCPQLPILTLQLCAEKLMFGRRDFYDFTARMCLGIKSRLALHLKQLMLVRLSPETGRITT